MGVFDRYWEEKNQYDAEHPVEAVKIKVAENPNLNLAILKQNIDHVDDMTDSELRRFISRCFKSIMINLFEGDEAAKYISSFQNPRFLEAFIDVVSDLQYLDKDDIVRCNTMCYHYITIPKEKQDPAIMNRMMQLSSIINRYNLPRLLGLGLSRDLASILLIARYSDIDLNICVRRVNFIIITQPKELMSEKMIEEIFKVLYNVMEDLYRIFPCIMLDVVPDYDEGNPKTYWVTEDIQEVSSTLNLALLNIIDNLQSQTIRAIFMNYTEAMSMMYAGRPVRFSLRNLSDDYYRINNVIAEMQYNEQIFVP